MQNIALVYSEPRRAVTIKEAAQMVGRSPSWVRDHISAGILPSRSDERGRATVLLSDITDLRRAVANKSRRSRRHLRLIINNS